MQCVQGSRVASTGGSAAESVPVPNDGQYFTCSLHRGRVTCRCRPHRALQATSCATRVRRRTGCGSWSAVASSRGGTRRRRRTQQQVRALLQGTHCWTHLPHYMAMYGVFRGSHFTPACSPPPMGIPHRTTCPRVRVRNLYGRVALLSPCAPNAHLLPTQHCPHASRAGFRRSLSRPCDTHALTHPLQA